MLVVMRERAYQTRFVSEVVESLKQFASVVAIAPTGSGKTFMAAQVARKWMRHSPGRILIIAQRNKINQQTAEFIERQYPSMGGVGLVCDGQRMYDYGIVVASIQSLHSLHKKGKMDRLLRHGRFSLAIIDEAHHAPSDSHIEVVWHLRQTGTRVLGISATYERGDNITLRQMFDAVACIIPTRELVLDGYLAEPIQLPVIDNDPTGRKMIDRYAHSYRDRRAVAFFETRKQSIWAAAYLREKHGIEAFHVDANTPGDDRKAIEKVAHVLCNVDIYTEGADLPGIGAVLIARTSTRTPYVQRAGRGMRPDTPDCIIMTTHCHHNLWVHPSPAVVLRGEYGTTKKSSSERQPYVPLDEELIQAQSRRARHLVSQLTHDEGERIMAVRDTKDHMVMRGGEVEQIANDARKLSALVKEMADGYSVKFNNPPTHLKMPACVNRVIQAYVAKRVGLRLLDAQLPYDQVAVGVLYVPQPEYHQDTVVSKLPAQEKAPATPALVEPVAVSDGVNLAGFIGGSVLLMDNDETPMPPMQEQPVNAATIIANHLIINAADDTEELVTTLEFEGGHYLTGATEDLEGIYDLDTPEEVQSHLLNLLKAGVKFQVG